MRITSLLISLLAVTSGASSLRADFPDSPIFPLWENVPMPGKTTQGEEELKGRFVPGQAFQSMAVFNVSKPTIQFYQVTSGTPTAAVIVCPGGAYHQLQYGSEGINVANGLNKIGVAAFLLKYRVPNKLEDKDRVLMDAQRAIRLIRANAVKWNIDPNKVGMIGFSAGGHLVAWMSTNFEKQMYEPVDEIDKNSARPDFAAMVYPAWLEDRKNKENPYALAPDLPVSEKTPPTFIAHSSDDMPFRNAPIAYYLALRKYEIPAELHLFTKAGHGYGNRPRGYPVDAWPQLFAEWLRYNGYAPKVQESAK